MDTMPTGPAPIDPASAGTTPTCPAGPMPAGPALPGALPGALPPDTAPESTAPATAAPATVAPGNTDDPAYWHAKAAAARAKARTLPWESDPELRAQVDMIMSMHPSERIRQLQAQIDLFASAVLVEE